MKNLFSLLLLLLAFQASYADGGHKVISGSVKTEKGLPVAYATIIVMSNDSNVLTSSVSDSLGRFKLIIKMPPANVKVGSAIMEVRHLGFESYFRKLDPSEKGTLDIIMKESSTILQEVTVTGNWLQHQNGNMIVNLSKMPGYEKYQMDKLLKYLPGVIKLQQGGYTYNGKPVTFYINGVKQNITETSLEEYLKAMPANAFSKVELTDINDGTHSSEQEAVISLQTRKHMVDGSYNQFGIFGSSYENGLNDLGGNYFYMMKKGKLLFHNLISFTNNNNYSTAADSTHLSGGQQFTDFGQKGGRYNSVTYNSRLIYNQSNNNTLEFGTFIYYDYGHLRTSWNTKNYSDNIPTANDYLYRIKNNDDLWTATLSYNIPKSKRKFNGSVSYNIMYGGLRSDNDYYQIEKDIENKYQTSELRMTGWMHTLDAAFKSSFGKWSFQYGGTVQYNTMKDKAYYNAVDAATSDMQNQKSKFHGREIIEGVYAKAEYRLSGNWSFAGTLRAENTDYKMYYDSENYNMSNQYLYLFPALFAYFNSENYSMTFGFNSGMGRPKYDDIIPGKREVNKYYYTQGNPEVKPYRFYSLTWSNTIMKYFLLSLRYNSFKDVSGNYFSVDENGKLFQKYDNYVNRESYVINLNLPVRLLEGKFYAQLSSRWIYWRNNTFKNGYTVPVGRKKEYWTHSYHLNTTYDVSDRLNINADLQYTPYTYTLDYSRQEMVHVEAGIEYSLLKKKNLIIGFNIRNIFGKNDSKINSYFIDNFRYTRSHNAGTVCAISLKLRLNKGQRVMNEYKAYNPDLERMSK